MSIQSSATLLISGVILSLLAGAFHPARENPNYHAAVFAEYSGSTYWTAIHLGQFVGMAVFLAGILVLLAALQAQSESTGWAYRLGSASALVALALYGVLQAVDGVALKQAVDAWARAPDLEKSARFASAESIRWLEWGVRSYQSLMLGLALVATGSTISRTPSMPAIIGPMAILSGLAYLPQALILGSEGFSAANTVPQLLAYLLILVWSTWLLLTARNEKSIVQ